MVMSLPCREEKWSHGSWTSNDWKLNANYSVSGEMSGKGLSFFPNVGMNSLLSVKSDSSLKHSARSFISVRRHLSDLLQEKPSCQDRVCPKEALGCISKKRFHTIFTKEEGVKSEIRREKEEL